ncbi:MAG: glycosyltransferase family 2 protein [Planctomycetota bacterium]
MTEPVDLLLISWNRRRYLERTLSRLLADPSDFRLFCWDNGSQDGAAELVAELDDPRVHRRRFSRDNVGQGPPSLWFLDQASARVAGKVDDDLLMPPGWTGQLAELLGRSDRFGVLSCWIYMPRDYDERLAAHNEVELAGARLLRTTSVGGAGFLGRLATLRAFVRRDKPGFPVDQVAMTLAGAVSGYPLPLLLAHHMDDPRSPFCLMRKDGERAAFTMRRLGHRTLEDYGAWIEADARRRQEVPFAEQLRRQRWSRDRSLIGRLRSRVLRAMGAL